MVDVTAFYLKFCVDEVLRGANCAPCRVERLPDAPARAQDCPGTPGTPERYCRKFTSESASAMQTALGLARPRPKRTQPSFIYWPCATCGVTPEFRAYIEGGTAYARQTQEGLAECKNPHPRSQLNRNSPTPLVDQPKRIPHERSPCLPAIITGMPVDWYYRERPILKPRALSEVVNIPYAMQARQISFPPRLRALYREGRGQPKLPRHAPPPFEPGMRNQPRTTPNSRQWRAPPSELILSNHSNA